MRVLSAGRSAGAFGAMMGLAAAGAAVGFAAERYAVGRSLRGTPDPYADEPFGALRGAAHMVTASDGVHLHVEVDEPRDPAAGDLTVVFSHGYALNLDAWHFQRRDLAGSARLVFWDQRSHGRSGRSPEGGISFEQLSDDLARVIDDVAPDGPVVLVGHSMGGMTLTSYVQRHPDRVGTAVVGAGLVATSSGGLREVTLGVPGPLGRIVHGVAPGVVSTLARRPDFIERGRKAGSDLGFVVTRRYSFSEDAPASLVEFTAELNAGTPVDVIAAFLPVFQAFDSSGGIGALRGIPTVVVGAGMDMLTPVEHSRRIAALLPEADYVEIERAGHMVLLEKHAVVTDHLRTLLERVRAERAGSAA